MKVCGNRYPGNLIPITKQQDGQFSGKSFADKPTFPLFVLFFSLEVQPWNQTPFSVFIMLEGAGGIWELILFVLIFSLFDLQAFGHSMLFPKEPSFSSASP